MTLPHLNGYFIELEEYEYLWGTTEIVWYEEFHDYYPVWLRRLMEDNVTSTKAVLEYVSARKGEFDES